MKEDSTDRFVPGLQGIVAAETRLSKIDGENGELVISGFPVEELAPRASFEEVVYLLWHDALPDARQLEKFKGSLAERRRLPETTLQLLEAAASGRVPVMDALRMAVGTVGLEASEDSSDAGYDPDALGLVWPGYPRWWRPTGACSTGMKSSGQTRS